jgi:hypothetical protein
MNPGNSNRNLVADKVRPLLIDVSSICLDLMAESLVFRFFVSAGRHLKVIQSANKISDKRQ